MFILLNGAFGVGKTTVARELQKRIGGAVFDPERIGWVLQRFSPRSDFQHIASWRRLTIRGARMLSAVRRPVIIPMAFSDLRYLDEIRTALGPDVQHFCLTAAIDVVRSRLEARNETNEWVFRRAAECCAVHGDPAFAVQIETAGRTPAQIAEDIAARVDAAVSARHRAESDAQ